MEAAPSPEAGGKEAEEELNLVTSSDQSSEGDGDKSDTDIFPASEDVDAAPGGRVVVAAG